VSADDLNALSYQLGSDSVAMLSAFMNLARMNTHSKLTQNALFVFCSLVKIKLLSLTVLRLLPMIYFINYYR